MNAAYRRCPCCQLDQPVAKDVTGVSAAVCAECTHHQGDQDKKRVQRAERHERMLRERLTACRESESKSRGAAAEAAKAATQAREATAAALHSRSVLAARIVEAAREAGRHTCPLVYLANDRAVIEWARRVEQEVPSVWRVGRDD